MKTIVRILPGAILLSVLITACEHPVRMETKVHEDGSLDKVIELDKADSIQSTKNVFGINESNGWKVIVNRSDTDSTTSKDEFKIRFEKSFPSAEAANQDLNTESDTLFRVQSKFEKSFRWFYTYMRYSETFKRMERLKKVKGEDYFNQEDQSFINRLPGEGTAISKADSFYLENLNEKIFKSYARMGMLYEQLDIITEVIKRNTDKKWVDTVYKNIEFVYNKLEDMEGDPFFAAKIADSLHIPLPKERAAKDFESLAADLNSRIRFMSFARDGKYANSVEMPWTVVNSNADSVSGNKLFWKPLATKFAVQEYEMFAEARRLNWWAVGVSILILALTIFLFLKRQPGIGYR
jgi:hypothetical protein